MLIKAGVDISRLNREIRRALQIVSDILDSHGQEIVITSTYEGNHGAGSLHYCDDAVDVRDPEPFIHDFENKVKDALGPDFDVVDEHDHIHIEYDPKG